jgi:hypothetical protein
MSALLFLNGSYCESRLTATGRSETDNNSLAGDRLKPDPCETFVTRGYEEMKEGRKSTERGHVDCQNDFFLSCDRRIGVMRLRADFSAKSKNKISNCAADLWHRERGIYDLDR